MAIDRFNAEGYYDPVVFEALTKIEKEERAARKAAAFTSFTIKPIQMKFTDPFAQAEYTYSLIESKVVAVE